MGGLTDTVGQNKLVGVVARHDDRIDLGAGFGDRTLKQVFDVDSEVFLYQTFSLIQRVIHRVAGLLLGKHIVDIAAPLGREYRKYSPALVVFLDVRRSDDLGGLLRLGGFGYNADGHISAARGGYGQGK